MSDSKGGKKGLRHTIKLSEEQAKAASYGLGTRAIIAPPGSGKTTMMSYRIASMIDDYGVNETDILATTFTKAGAHDLKDRIDLMAGRKTNIQTGTLHSFCVNILLKYYPLLGYGESITILDESQKDSLLKQIIFKVTGVQSTKELTEFSIEDVNKVLGEMDVREFSNDERDKNPRLLGKKLPMAVGQVCNAYRKSCIDFGYVDFDSILTTALRILKLGNKEVIASLPKHVFVDEAQDLSGIQWFVVEEMAKYALSLDVIGDDDQSIYAWRAALPWRFRHFLEKADHKYIINANRRCGKHIVSLAADIISAIPKERRVEKDLSATREEEGFVRYTVLPGAQWVILAARKIATEVKNGKSFSDYSFIVRAKSAFPAIEGALKQLRIPYQIFGGKSTFNRPESRFIRSVGNIVLCKDSKEPLAHWQTLFSDIGMSPGAIDNVMDKVKAAGGSNNNLYWVVKESRLSAANKQIVSSVIEAVSVLRKVPNLTFGGLLANEVVNKNVSNIVGKRAEAEIMARKRKEGGITDAEANILIQNLKNERMDALNLAFSSYLNESLSSAIMTLELNEKDKDDTDNSPKVTLTTVHSSKGLEWDTVFIMEANENSWPSPTAWKGLKGAPDFVHEEVQDEERRLLYVAVTRAKNNVYFLSSAYHPIRKGELQKPSLFFPRWLQMETESLFQKVIESQSSVAKTITFEHLKKKEDDQNFQKERVG